MSGYLQRLVERASGTGAMIKPLLAPHFASGPSLIGETGEVWEQTEATPQGPAAMHPETTPDQPDRRPLPASPPEATEPPQPGQEMMTQPLRESLEAKPSESISEAQPGLPVSTSTPAETLASPNAPELSPDSRAEFVSGQVDDDQQALRKTRQNEQKGKDQTIKPALQKEHLEEPALGEKRAPLAPRLVRKTLREQPPIEASSEVAAVEPSEMSAPAPVEPDSSSRLPEDTIPQVRPRVEYTPTPQSPSLPIAPENSDIAGAQPRSIIRVTIGRIDVRAVPASEPAPRPTLSKRTPALTLQEYLKRRNGGEA